MKQAAGLLILSLLIITTAASCNAEKHMARKMLQTHDSLKVCLISPGYLLKQNMKTWEIKGYDSIPANKRDSVSYYHSKFLQYVNDSLFLNHYNNTVKEELEKYGVHVYTQDSTDAFLASEGNLYMFNVAQLTLEEYMEPFKKTLDFDTTHYKWEIWCNAMALNVWYEATVLNVTDSKMKLLYGNMYVRDNITGRFSGDPFMGTIKYLYNVDSITTSSAYRLAGRAAKVHAGYLFDFIINDRIARKKGTALPPEEYLHYDPAKRSFRKAGDYRFTEIK